MRTSSPPAGCTWCIQPGRSQSGRRPVETQDGRRGRPRPTRRSACRAARPRRVRQPTPASPPATAGSSRVRARAAWPARRSSAHRSRGEHRRHLTHRPQVAGDGAGDLRAADARQVVDVELRDLPARSAARTSVSTGYPPRWWRTPSARRASVRATRSGPTSAMVVPVTRETRRASTRFATRAVSGHAAARHWPPPPDDEIGTARECPALASTFSGSTVPSQSQKATKSAVAASSPAWQAAP